MVDLLLLLTLDNLSNLNINFTIISGSSDKAIYCKKIGKIGVIEFVNAELIRGQSFSLPNWFKPSYNATYGSIVCEDDKTVTEILISKTVITVYPSTSTKGATGQIVVILE